MASSSSKLIIYSMLFASIFLFFIDEKVYGLILTSVVATLSVLIILSNSKSVTMSDMFAFASALTIIIITILAIIL